LNDYARPAVAFGSTYRPAHSAAKEDDFMAQLLSSVTASSNEAARKRKSSPDFPSSDPHEPSSDHSFFGAKKRYGQESDEEDDYSRRRSTVGKKPRVSEATIMPADENEPDYGDYGDYGGMDVDEPPVKAEVVSDDDEIMIKPKTAPLASAKLNGQAAQRRRVVNSTSVKHVEAKPEPIVAKAEPEMTPVKPRFPMEKKPLNGAAHWSSVQETLEKQVKSSELDVVKAPTGSVKVENVIEEDGTVRMFWLDQMEQDGVVHLVGKVLDRQTNKYVSACVSVNGIKRNLFVKPRAKRFRESRIPPDRCGSGLPETEGGHETDLEVTKTDVYQDFDEYRRKEGIEEWAAKFVQRKYAFEDPGVEKGESEWMKVVYGFDRESPLLSFVITLTVRA
jgi:DNA polymerase alpha subunit A